MKIVPVVLRVFDFGALAVALIAGATALGAAVMVGLYNAAKFLLRGIADGWADKSDRWFLIAVVVSALWCWFRRDALNRPGS